MTCAILGSGAWGTAVAIQLAKRVDRVLLWARNKKQVDDMVQFRCNQAYLPNLTLPPNLEPTYDLNLCMQAASQLIIAVPSHAFMALINQIEKPKSGIAWITKGLDPTTCHLFSELIAEKWGHDFPTAIISGPSFAKEVAMQLPTALVVASHHNAYQQQIATLLHGDNIRVYFSNDINGVQICGAIKNILAIACGISDGLCYGANAKAALITRGLAEMRRLGLCLGAHSETFLGLAGVGDLVLTCTDDQSRNRRFGLKLGQHVDPVTALKQIGQVVEGFYNVSQICDLAKQHQIEMPICQEVHALLQGKISPEEAVHHLMARPLKDEFES